ncbi:MAG: class I SAM-dependent rRNA methyltransferase [bacterium]
MPRLWLKKGREKGIKSGYLWIHPSDVERISSSAQDGAALDVMDSKDRFLGRALLNRNSPILARLFSRKRTPWDKQLLRERLLKAVQHRKAWGLDLSASRIVFGESDGIPGLVVDSYGSVAVVQITHPALEPMRKDLAGFLEQILGVSVVYERSDTPTRAQEGLEPKTGPILGELPGEIWIREGGLMVKVDVERGQKTGHYLDQKRNRLLVGPMARDRQVLDLFCYTGGFGLQCLAAGAKQVVFADSSGSALELAKANVERLGLSWRCQFVECNGFDLLRQMERQGRKFGMICLDPPAFAHSKTSLPGATRGYRELNLRAFKLLEPHGILVSSSCSSHLPVGLHLQILLEACLDAGREALLLYQWGQDLDHPVMPGHAPSRYLKCHVMQVLDPF